MHFDGIGSSVVIALAAVLWFVYLVPIWLRRREYLATERNAVRLQQTMRIMAESAELPDAVLVEVSARSVAAQQRALRQAERAARGRAGRVGGGAAADVAGAARAAVPGEGAASYPAAARARFARRVQRTRAVATLLLLIGLVGAVVGLSLLVGGGEWLLLATSAGLAVSALAVLNRLATVSARFRAVRRAAVSRVQPSLYDQAGHEHPAASSGWTPVPLPRPLYLSRESVLRAAGAFEPRAERARVSRAVDPAAELAMAAAEAELALREAQDARRAVHVERERLAEGTAARPAPEESSPFARMGVVDESAFEIPDVEEIMRRRVSRAG